jgi:cytochrome d ubiquinol oxidase subunit I
MQTPAGFEIVDGRFVPTAWLAIPARRFHILLATAVCLTTAFTVIGVAAWYLRRAQPVEAEGDDRDGVLASYAQSWAVIGDTGSTRSRTSPSSRRSRAVGHAGLASSAARETTKQTTGRSRSEPHLTHDADGVIGLKDFPTSIDRRSRRRSSV